MRDLKEVNVGKAEVTNGILKISYSGSKTVGQKSGGVDSYFLLINSLGFSMLSPAGARVLNR